MIATRTRSTPRTVAEVQAILAQADAEGSAVLVEGGRTLSEMGSAPSGCDITLSTTRLDKLITHEQHDLTCAAEAGMRVAALNEALAKHGQFVPIDVPFAQKATLGGSFATGWLGPRRHRFGRIRDLVIGSQVVLANGTVAKAGGMVVKNVSGYDMSKLYAGSFGTLGVVTQLNFKTLPVNRHRRIILAQLPEATRARTVLNVAQREPVPSAAFCIEGFRKVIDGEDGIDGRVIILLEGPLSLVDRATREMRIALGRSGVPESVIIDTGAGECFERILDACVTNVGTRSVTYRSLGLPSDAEERARRMRDACNRCQLYTDVLLDALNGDVFIRASDRHVRDFAQKIDSAHAGIREIDPQAVIVAGDAPVREYLEAWGAPPPAIEHMRALKASFDPKNTLNPGRFIV